MPFLSDTGFHARHCSEKKRSPFRRGMKACIRQKPAATYFPAMGSIIGAGELGFRVRDGNGHVLPAMAAGV